MDNSKAQKENEGVNIILLCSTIRVHWVLNDNILVNNTHMGNNMHAYFKVD